VGGRIGADSIDSSGGVIVAFDGGEGVALEKVSGSAQPPPMARTIVVNNAIP
jgi:hypothetical protein